MPRVAHQGRRCSSDVHSESSRGICTEPVEIETQTPQGRLCFTHLLPRCLSVSHPVDMVSHFPTTSLSASGCLSLLLSGGHPCPRHLFHRAPHTETVGGKKGDGAKQGMSEEGKDAGVQYMTFTGLFFFVLPKIK